MEPETPIVVKILGGGMCAVVGILVAYVGIARPAGMWSSAKIQNAVRVIGDAGMSAVLIGLGLASLAGSILIFVRR